MVFSNSRRHPGRSVAESRGSGPVHRRNPARSRRVRPRIYALRAPSGVTRTTDQRTSSHPDQFGFAHRVHDDDREPWATIVGIVGDVHQYGLDKAPDAAIYLAFMQAKEPQGWASLVVRSTLPAERIEAEVRKAMRAVDPMTPIFHLQAMDAYIAKSLAQRTFTLSLIGVFGTLALILAAVGIYGVVSYTVSMRTREVGIRMALGAESRDVIVLILQRVGVTALWGLAIGLAISLLCAKTLAGLLFEFRRRHFIGQRCRQFQILSSFDETAGAAAGATPSTIATISVTSLPMCAFAVGARGEPRAASRRS